MAGQPEDPVRIDFGRFTVVRHRRELLADGRPVELGGRAFDTLLALIDARGTVLGKDELMSRVWPDRVVEENNLPAQISVLRKLLGAKSPNGPCRHGSRRRSRTSVEPTGGRRPHRFLKR